MKKVLFIKHIAIEGPGTLEAFLNKHNIATETIELYEEDLYLLSLDLRKYVAVVILGGPMNVYEEDKYPYLNWEDSLIKEALKSQIPLLGICLGAQLIAKAAGAKIHQAPQKEIGWFDVYLREEARSETLFNGINGILKVFQWHEDTFALPDGAVLLAQSNSINQAFRIGNAYGLQFHIEVTTDMVKEWANYYHLDRDSQLIAATEYPKIRTVFETQRDRIFQNFLSFILPKN